MRVNLSIIPLSRMNSIDSLPHVLLISLDCKLYRVSRLNILSLAHVCLIILLPRSIIHLL
jgi:hypothetical protein